MVEPTDHATFGHGHGHGLPDAWAVEVQSGNPLSIHQLVVNFLRAIERFRLQNERAAEHQLEAESLGFAALSEALNWADSIDNYLRQGPRNTAGTDRNPEWIADLDQYSQELMRAFDRVRNLVHHQWWRAVATRAFGGTAADQRPRWVWGSLPRQGSEGRGRELKGDAAYASALKGKDVLDTLDDLAAIFWRKRGWQISRVDVVQPGHDVLSPLVFDDEA